MSGKEILLSPQIKALKTTDLSPFIRMSGLMAPRMLAGFLKTLDPKQKNAFDKVMPIGGQKKFFIQLVGAVTPPIVVQLAQPLQMNVFTEYELKKHNIKGVKFTLEDLQIVKEKRIGRFLWRIKSQIGTLLSLSGMFVPFILLGPGGIKDLENKAMVHFKPLVDMMPGAKRN
jgi:hypothetical protein